MNTALLLTALEQAAKRINQKLLTTQLQQNAASEKGLPVLQIKKITVSISY